jgi:hypothetical protein
MLGMKVAYRSIPFFWTKQYNVSLRYVGNARNWHDIIVDSDLSSKSFIAYYLRDGKVLAAAGVNRDTEMAVIEELMRKNKLPKVDDLPMAKEKMASLARGQ